MTELLNKTYTSCMKRHQRHERLRLAIYLYITLAILVRFLNIGPWGGLSTPSNGYFMSIQGAGSYLEQTVTGLTPGNSYTITFQASQRPGNPQAQMTVSAVGVGAETYEASADF